jgi:hypothetical protein
MKKLFISPANLECHMKPVAIDVCRDTKHNPGILTVGEAIKAFTDLNHAGEVELHILLDNPEQTPVFLLEKSQTNAVNAILFAGTIKKDENGHDYVTAVYVKGAKGLVTEKYWLTYPMPGNLRFALAS